MADIIDVMTALKALCVEAIYPNGTDQPSIINAPVLFRLGRPNPVSLDQELKSQQARINIYADVRERDVTRFPYHAWEVVSVTEPTIFLTSNNTTTPVTLTVSGTASINQTCVVTLNYNNAIPYAYAVQASDTPATIAASLAALIPNASAIGAVITVANAYFIAGNVSTPAIAIRELKRQQRVLRISIKTFDPATRDQLANSLDIYLAEIPSFELVNDYSVRLIYQSSPINDMSMKANNLSQRDLIMQVEYSTIKTKTFYTIADAFANVTRTSTISP